MYFAFNRIKQQIPSFNRFAHDYDDFLLLARRASIKVTLCDYDDEVKGYYCVEKLPKTKRHHIVINAKLNRFERAVTGLHELGHFHLHVPATKREYFFRTAKISEEKHDLEAEAVATVLMIPQKLLFELAETPFDELHPFTQEILLKRWEIYKKHGV